ncbi:FAD-binding oxidoreductase [Sporomusa termitida]|uniref:GlcD: glycolate oxidase, subunit GlcD n=1 Tax=Sporomusa termitida TaxID=2377 RepID=A0A517DP67_9FIRM|nr:FAD-binding oxidoreductase [Sporomusa termitida]QDR79154.1 glcD: glycolate oxidase, subunit GlcD [Sporomusa termitida]
MSHSTSPRSIEELQHLLRLSSEAGRPLYVYRQGNDDGLTVDLQELNKIIEIDAANLVATVHPGVKLGTLASRLGEQGLRFMPADTPFYHDKTIGQLFYEGCSNISSLKYGYTKHFLMGSEIVLPTGELLKTGGKTVKNVTGYDFTRFFNAPYTDYGIAVKFLLKLLPLPESRRGLAATFAGLEQLLAFMRKLRDSRLVPAYLLWIDPGVQNLYQAGGQGPLVLLEFDGLAAETAEQAQHTLALIETYGGTIRAAADSYGRLASQWAALYRPGGNYVLTDEYKLAFTRQEEFIKQFYAIAEKFAVQAGLFGQLAEGKLNIALSRPEPEQGFIDAVLQAVIQAGGIAAGKYDRLAGRRGRGALAMLEQRAKAAFDPKMILNR